MAGGPKPDIWTREQFKALTGGKWPRKKLATIDGLLDQWAMALPKSVMDRYGVLMQLAPACEAYIDRQENKLQIKQAKSDKHRLSRKPSELLKTRITQTKLLAEQVFRRLAYEMHEYRKTYMVFSQVHNVRNHGGLQALRPGYTNERTAFTQFKAANNLSGVATHQGGSINPQGGTYAHKVLHDVLATPQGIQKFEATQNKVIPPNILNLANTNFSNLTSVQFQQLHQYFTPDPNVGMGIVQGADPLVHYYRKDERLKDIIMVPMNGKLRNPDGTLHSSRKVGLDFVAEAWAMDEYGNLLVKDFTRAQQINVNGVDVMFNHSSLAAGNDVICAGMIEINQGDVVLISNESGHYQPSAQKLANALLVMKEELGLDVENTVTSIKDMASGITYNSVTAFWAVHPHV